MWPEFGVENEGKVALVHSALYGGKSAGSNHLRSCMHHLGFKSCPDDPDAWMRPAIKSDGTEVYEYLLLYTDDSLSIGVYAESSLSKEIGNTLNSRRSRLVLPSCTWRPSEPG